MCRISKRPASGGERSDAGDQVLGVDRVGRDPSPGSRVPANALTHCCLGRVGQVAGAVQYQEVEPSARGYTSFMRGEPPAPTIAPGPLRVRSKPWPALCLPTGEARQVVGWFAEREWVPRSMVGRLRHRDHS